MQLHEFCDASESAYAGGLYLRAVDQDGFIHVSLIMAKTKVAPIKCLTMPRLEMCGAVIVAKLLSRTARILDISNNNFTPGRMATLCSVGYTATPDASKHL